MYLIEIFLPLTDNKGTPFARAVFDQVRQEWMNRWGGVTTFLRAPAEGTWKEASSTEKRGEIIIDVSEGESARPSLMERIWRKTTAAVSSR